MPADSNSLTFILQLFLTAFQSGRGAVGVDAFHLLGILATLELTVAAIWWAIVGDDVLVALMKKILLVGFFIFVVSNYDSLLSTVSLGFIHTGEVAGSAGGGNMVSVTNPSTIISAGLQASQPIFDHIKQASVFTDLADIVISGLCGVVILLAFFIIAIQVFVTYLEFGIVTTLGLILIPFGVFRYTAFLAEKVFGAIISFGVKLMVLAFLVSVTVPVLQGFKLPADPTWTQLFNMVGVCLAIMALAWHAPGVAAGMMSGGPSLTAGTAAGTTLAAGAGVAGAALASAGVTKLAARAVGGGVAGAQSGMEGMRGHSANQAAVAAAGALGATAGAAKAVVAPMGSGVKTAYQAGRTSGGDTHSAANSSGYKASLVQTMQHVKTALPDTAHPSGGVSVPLKHDK